MRNKKLERQARAQGKSLRNTGRIVWLVAVIVAALCAFAAYALIQSIVYDASRVQHTLQNAE